MDQSSVTEVFSPIDPAVPTERCKAIMKAELPVIANQHGAVKVLNNSVHTACHVLGV